MKIMMLTAGLVILFTAPEIAWSDSGEHSKSTFQTSEAYFIAGGAAVGGGTLNRTKRSVFLRVSMADLDKNATYSAWFIIFNDPSQCSFGTIGSCGPNPDPNGGPGDEPLAAVINAGGFVTGDDGTGYFVGELSKRDHPDGVCCGDGVMKNGMKAEIHIVIETHGAILPGEVSTQMSVPFGACNPIAADDPNLDPPNVVPSCEDQFFLVFMAPYD